MIIESFVLVYKLLNNNLIDGKYNIFSQEMRYFLP